MKRLSLLSSVAVLGFLAGGGTASAQGLEFLHDQRIEGNKSCFVDHSHSGTSGGHATRAAAEKAAIESWSGFTALEYGNNWGSWRLASGKSMNCSQATGSWGCQIEARPCKPAVGAAARRARAK